jgi:hypothetical protein
LKSDERVKVMHRRCGLCWVTLDTMSPIEDVHKRLGELAERQTDPVLLAVEADVAVGLIAMHWTAMLHVNRRVARITALIVFD